MKQKNKSSKNERRTFILEKCQKQTKSQNFVLELIWKRRIGRKVTKSVAFMKEEKFF